MTQFFRLWSFVDQNAVNLLTHDDWDDMLLLFRDSSAWEMFRYQHGPRRLGLGLWLTHFVFDLSHWNLRSHTFVMASVLGVCSFLGLWLKKRIFGKIVWTDSIIPLLFMNLNQWELLLYLPLNGIVMLALFLLLALAFTVENVWLKGTFVVILNFLLIHTGYGMFAVGATGLVLLAELRQRPRFCIPVGALLGVCIAVFFYGYRSEPGLDCFKFPHERPWEYFVFASLMMSRFFGFVKTTGFAAVLSAMFFVGTIFVLMRTAKKSKKPSQVIFLLVAFSLLYSLNAAVGRVCASVYAGKVSRYVTFMIPQMLGFYFFFLQLNRGTLRRIFVGLNLLLAIFSTFYFDKRDLQFLNEYVQSRKSWVQCFQNTLSVEDCSKSTGLFLYPNSHEKVKHQIEFLRDHKLNFFSEQE